MKHIKLLTLLTALLIGLSAKAHSPTEIGFRFSEEQGKTYLEVHLTTSTLFDLLHYLHPELKSEESLKLSNYINVYEDYFNSSLTLELNNTDRSLTYVDSNLIIHDATIKFLIRGFEEAIEQYSLKIGGFEFYQKPSFTVLFATQSVADTCFLSKTENTCAGEILKEEIRAETNPLAVFWMAGLIAGLLLLTWMLQRRFV